MTSMRACGGSDRCFPRPGSTDLARRKKKRRYIYAASEPRRISCHRPGDPPYAHPYLHALPRQSPFLYPPVDKGRCDVAESRDLAEAQMPAPRAHTPGLCIRCSGGSSNSDGTRRSAFLDSLMESNKSSRSEERHKGSSPDKEAVSAILGPGTNAFAILPTVLRGGPWPHTPSDQGMCRRYGEKKI